MNQFERRFAVCRDEASSMPDGLGIKLFWLALGGINESWIQTLLDVAA
jgi:hypothetical protein